MSKQPVPLEVGDTSRFARQLSEQLRGLNELPSHLSMMNMLARAAGFQNYQHLKASHSAKARLELARPRGADFRLVERTLHQFDPKGRLLRWPSRRPVQDLCLWVLWSQIPKGQILHERDVNAVLNEAHLFGDPALLRRALFGADLVSRNLDGSCYERLEKHPSAEALEVIGRVKAMCTT